MQEQSEKPRLKVSGYRGVWGKDLTEEITFQYALAFAKVIKSKGGSKILICRDARPSGTLMLEAVITAFEKEGITYEYGGILPTPSILLLVKKLGFDGGIMITASHNPAEYNGLKMVMSNGLFAIGEEIDEIENTKNTLTDAYEKTETKSREFDNLKFRKIHVDQVLNNIDVELIKSKKFKVALDPINSTGSIITKELFEALGVEHFIINGKQDGDFVHMPEPRPENLIEIGKTVLENKTDIGFAQDPDADRLVLVNEKGEVLSEEYTLPLAIKSALDTHYANEASVVTNLSTSSMSTDIAREMGALVYITKIGEPNVVEEMLKVNALIGGEGNGGVIYPTINTGRDSLVGIGLTLELLARDGRKISEIADSLPHYFMRKEKIPLLGNLPTMYEKLKALFPDAATNELEGIRFDWPDHAWVHIRPSNTEPIVRIFGEAKDQARIDSIFDKTMSLLG